MAMSAGTHQVCLRAPKCCRQQRIPMTAACFVKNRGKEKEKVIISVQDIIWFPNLFVVLKTLTVPEAFSSQ